MRVKASEVAKGAFLWGVTASSESFKVQAVIVTGEFVEFKGCHGDLLGTLHRYHRLNDMVSIARTAVA